MKIIPYGKNEDYFDAVVNASLDNLPSKDKEDEIAEKLEEDSTPADQETKVQQMEDAISEILGEPSLDNLMIILTAIGMSKISLSMSEDKTHLSVAGIISLSEDKKIKKE